MHCKMVRNAAVQTFSKEFDPLLNESTVKSLKKSYVTAQEAKKRKRGEVDVVLDSLPPKKHGYFLVITYNYIHKCKLT